MNRVSEILARKGADVHSVPSGTTVLDAIRRMVEANVGSLLIVDGDAVAGGCLLGMDPRRLAPLYRKWLK